MTTLPAIAILGAGSMGGAILAGLTAPEVAVEGGIRVTNRSEAKAAALRNPGVLSLATELEPDANRRALDGARLVIVAVKPAMVPQLLAEVADRIDPDAIVVSVAAGVTTASIERIVPNPVVRAMPNTPSLVRRGITGVAAGSRADAASIELVQRVFETVGVVLVVPESQIDALGAISGSGPAYVFYLIEQLTATAIGLGFEPDDAATLVEQTFLGASELLAASDAGPRELRRRVTSPKGTTERAIAELEATGLRAVFDRTTAAAIARSAELARGS